MNDTPDSAHAPQHEASAATDARQPGDGLTTGLHSPKGKKPHRHIIKPSWLRRTLKVLLGLLVFILLLPWLLYIPPVQTLVKDIACDQVHKSTGMKIEIDRFRLRFPLDVSLDGVTVLEASGDTMVRARTADVDVRMLPLLHLDIQVKKLHLADAYYRMLSEDSSMTLKIYAPYFDATPGASADIKQSIINIDEATLRGGRIDLYMDVWKSKPKPPTPGVFIIRAKKLRLQDFTFAMSMLPTIDSLGIHAHSLELEGGLVDLKNNLIEIQKAQIGRGSATYITPTAQYVATHPAPPPSPYKSAPITIKGHEIGLTGFSALYATKGARPQPGFDPAFMQFTGLNLQLADFYNQETTLRLPVTRLEGRERCGLTITSGSGLVDIDSTGIGLKDLIVTTTASRLQADAYMSMGSMAMEPKAPFTLKGIFSIGQSDIAAFMPSAGKLLRPFARFGALQAQVNARGCMADIAIDKLQVQMPGFINLRANGRVANVMQPAKLNADLDFYGNLMQPGPVKSLLELKDFDLPPFLVQGHATAAGQDYAAQFTLTSPAGDVRADGRVGLSSERYYADVDMRGMDVGRFAPGSGLGIVTGHLLAKGTGFNPTKPGAVTNVDMRLDRVDYNKYPLTGILAKATLHNGAFDVDLSSDNDALTGDISATGTIGRDLYDVDMTADIAQLDLRLLGLSPDTMDARGSFRLTGSVSPSRMTCDMNLVGSDLYYRSGPSVYDLPGDISAALLATPDTTHAQIDARGIFADFTAPQGMKHLLPQMERALKLLTHQVMETKKLDMAELQTVLPVFAMQLHASGQGLVEELLKPSELALDSISAEIVNDTLFRANAAVTRFSTTSMTLDTITASFRERGQLLDYALHVGNAPGNMDEYADVNLTGYVGLQRASAFLRQKNLRGETGYRLGATVFFTDTLATLHFTPLKATIGYLPWTFNSDNYISYDMNRRVDANLSAQSKESRISLRTVNLPGKEMPMLSLGLDNVNLHDFMQIMPGLPDITGVLNADANLVLEGSAFTGDGTISLRDFTYDGRRVADFNGTFNAGLDLTGNTSAHAELDIDGHKAFAFNGTLAKGPDGSLQPTDMSVDMSDFPVSVANAFLPADMAQVSGHLTGTMSMTGSMTSPVLNGNVTCRDVKVLIPMMAGTLTLDTVPLTVVDSKVTFNDFDIYGVRNSLKINGTVDATKLSDTRLDLSLSGRNFMLIDNDKRTRSQIYGKVLLNANATVRGPMSLLDVQGDLSVLSGTDVAYTLSDAEQMAQTDAGNVVRFVQFSDSTLVATADSLEQQSTMRITAGLNISNGVKVTVNLNSNGTNCVQLSPYGQLSYFQNYMGDMRLNGQLNLGAGFARYSIPALGEKRFDIAQDSYVAFTGDILNPTLHVTASDEMKSAVSSGGNSSRVINFLVTISATGTLSRPNVLFDLSTNDDISISNELQSMSVDQRSNEAMNMILYGRYTGPGSASSGGAAGMATNALYGFLAGQLNNWAANNIRGVDLTFGIDQYATTTDGRSGTSTSYSYQVSKSLLNNKFKIVVGGNYSTDPNQDQDIAESLISNISFEYMLRQTNSTSMYVKLFRHTNYESILEGEITETGVGFVMQRKLSNLKQLFSWLRRKRKQNKDAGMPDPPTPTATRLEKEGTHPGAPEPTDSIKQ